MPQTDCFTAEAYDDPYTYFSSITLNPESHVAVDDAANKIGRKFDTATQPYDPNEAQLYVTKPRPRELLYEVSTFADTPNGTLDAYLGVLGHLEQTSDVQDNNYVIDEVKWQPFGHPDPLPPGVALDELTEDEAIDPVTKSYRSIDARVRGSVHVPEHARVGLRMFGDAVTTSLNVENAFQHLDRAPHKSRVTLLSSDQRAESLEGKKHAGQRYWRTL